MSKKILLVYIPFQRNQNPNHNLVHTANIHHYISLRVRRQHRQHCRQPHRASPPLLQYPRRCSIITIINQSPIILVFIFDCQPSTSPPCLRRHEIIPTPPPISSPMSPLPNLLFVFASASRRLHLRPSPSSSGLAASPSSSSLGLSNSNSNNVAVKKSRYWSCKPSP